MGRLRGDQRCARRTQWCSADLQRREIDSHGKVAPSRAVGGILGHLVWPSRHYLRIDCEPSGEATYRRREKEAGLEGDRTFHFGANAERMRGMENYDFDVDPPPDLAIEVEASHSADDAIAAWGRLGVPEVWRFDAATSTCTFWNRRDDGTYEQVDRSMFLPDARSVRCGRPDSTWRENWERRNGIVQLEDWVRDVIQPTARSRRSKRLIVSEPRDTKSMSLTWSTRGSIR